MWFPFQATSYITNSFCIKTRVSALYVFILIYCYKWIWPVLFIFLWPHLCLPFFCSDKLPFLGPLVPSVLDFGWLCPLVLKPGWMHHYLCHLFIYLFNCLHIMILRVNSGHVGGLPFTCCTVSPLAVITSPKFRNVYKMSWNGGLS